MILFIFLSSSPKAFYASFDTPPHPCFLSIGSWRKRRSESSCGGTWRICRSGSCRVWPRPAETRRTCRRERTQARASQRPVLPTPPRNRTHANTHTDTHTQCHSTVKHNNYLTWEPINASISVWKHTHTHTPCRHYRHKHMNDSLSICRYLKYTEAHITHNEWDIKEKNEYLSHASYSFICFIHAFHTPASLHLFFLFLMLRDHRSQHVKHTCMWWHTCTHSQSNTYILHYCHSRTGSVSLGPDPSPPSIDQQTLHTVKRWRGMNYDDPKDENSLKVQILMFLLLQLILWVLLLC